MKHHTIEANGARFHVAVEGSGPALLLLHGWPEYWATWDPVMQLLADRFTLYAPDLRGFGDSDKPAGPWGAPAHAQDMQALIEALGLERVGVVGHDVGGALMQPLARAVPQRISGLFFFNVMHPGVGARMATPARLGEIWYQSFNQSPIAPALVGASRESCRAYIGYILDHWSHRKGTFEPVMEAWIDNFMKPGNLEGGFAYYKGAHAGRIAMLEGTAAALPPIALPTCVRWGGCDPLFPTAWTDTLHETFSTLDLEVLEDVGHFPHREAPERAAEEIGRFFRSLG
jgi:pimeloyl-ACP methyl ester carboxylesterase